MSSASSKSASLPVHPNAVAATKAAPWLLLFGRTALFLAIQALFAFGFRAAGSAAAWEDGADWWPFVVILANLICLVALRFLFRLEGKNYREIFRIRRENVKGDLLALLGSMVIAGPLGVLPNMILGRWLFTDSQALLDLFVRPLPLWAAWLAIFLFPITQGLTELPLYFGYAMPRLDGRRFPDLRPILLPSLMLGLQHFAVPLLFDIRFITWRALMYIPFAFVIGLVLHRRPRLLPYLAIIHVLMDLSLAPMFLAAAY